MHHPTDRTTYTTAFVTLVVKHWVEREIAQWVHHEGSWNFFLVLKMITSFHFITNLFPWKLLNFGKLFFQYFKVLKNGDFWRMVILALHLGNFENILSVPKWITLEFSLPFFPIPTVTIQIFYLVSSHIPIFIDFLLFICSVHAKVKFITFPAVKFSHLFTNISELSWAL